MQWASGGQDGCVRVWEGRRGVAGWATPDRWTEHVAWQPRGLWLAFAAGKHLGLWRPDRPTQPPQLLTHSHTVTGIRWASGGEALWSVSHRALARYSAQGWTAQGRWDAPCALLNVHPSPDGCWVACGRYDQAAHLWSLPEGRAAEMHGFPGKLDVLAWNAHGSMLVTGGSHCVVVWRLAPGVAPHALPAVLEAHSCRITALRFTEDDMLLSAAEDGCVFAWSLSPTTPPTASRPALVTHHTHEAVALAWNPHHQRLAVGFSDGLIRCLAPPSAPAPHAPPSPPTPRSPHGAAPHARKP
jgi:WD40 repeat protein